MAMRDPAVLAVFALHLSAAELTAVLGGSSACMVSTAASLDLTVAA